MVFDKIKRAFSDSFDDESTSDEYVEIDLGMEEKRDNKVLVKLFNLKQYDDTQDVLSALREGYTIAIIDIQTLRKKDPIELKRSISKIKKTADALEGSIAGFGENTVIVTPSFAKIQKQISQPKTDERKFDTY